MAYRKTGEIYRSGEKTISDAIRKRVASWAIDEETLADMKRRKISAVGVFCKDSGDLWLANIDWWFNRKLVTFMNFERRGGALQRYMPLQHFRRKSGRARIRI